MLLVLWLRLTVTVTSSPSSTEYLEELKLTFGSATFTSLSRMLVDVTAVPSASSTYAQSLLPGATHP